MLLTQGLRRRQRQRKRQWQQGQRQQGQRHQQQRRQKQQLQPGAAVENGCVPLAGMQQQQQGGGDRQQRDVDTWTHGGVNAPHPEGSLGGLWLVLVALPVAPSVLPLPPVLLAHPNLHGAAYHSPLELTTSPSPPSPPTPPSLPVPISACAVALEWGDG
ncbi:hypothetical protein CLOM_g15792 [Closterium sp. NIES-68]|nr:hypothetical protein CLOM_g15792 [Closterium sp. NIES-68]